VSLFDLCLIERYQQRSLKDRHFLLKFTKMKYSKFLITLLTAKSITIDIRLIISIKTNYNNRFSKRRKTIKISIA